LLIHTTRTATGTLHRIQTQRSTQGTDWKKMGRKQQIPPIRKPNESE
jgi:hypothetical protein